MLTQEEMNKLEFGDKLVWDSGHVIKDWLVVGKVGWMTLVSTTVLIQGNLDAWSRKPEPAPEVKKPLYTILLDLGEGSDKQTEMPWEPTRPVYNVLVEILNEVLDDENCSTSAFQVVCNATGLPIDLSASMSVFLKCSQGVTIRRKGM